MNSAEISKAYMSEGKNLNERTVRRWMGFLRKNDFWYYPYPNYNALGLGLVTVLFRNVKNESALASLPYAVYIMPCSYLNPLENALLACYRIPPAYIENFKGMLENLKSEKAVGEFEVFLHRDTFDFYSPFHKSITLGGDVEIKEDNGDVSYFTNLFRKKIASEHSVKIHNEVRRNPFLMPVLMEYFKGSLSSRKVWFKIKEKLGKRVWDYVKDVKYSSIGFDGVGIKAVQDTLKSLNQMDESFFHQIRVFYRPMYAGKNVGLFFFLNLRDGKSLPELAEKIAENSVFNNVFIPLDMKTGVLFYITTSSERATKIIKSIIPDYTDSSPNNRVLWRDYQKSRMYWDKSVRKAASSPINLPYEKLFDPVKLEWTFPKIQ